MLLAKTEPLRRELATALPERGFTVRFWDGTELPATKGSTNGGGSANRGVGSNGDASGKGNGYGGRGPTFTVRSPKAVAHVVRAPASWARPGIRGRRSRGGRPRPRDRPDRRLPGAPYRQGDARAAGDRGAESVRVDDAPRAPKGELRLRGRSHSKDRDAKAVRHHYDVSNELLQAVPRRVDDLQLRDLLARGRDAGGGPAREARPRVQEAGAEGGRARARRGLRVGRVRDPRRPRLRGEGGGDHPVASPGRTGAPADRRSGLERPG